MVEHPEVGKAMLCRKLEKGRLKDKKYPRSSTVLAADSRGARKANLVTCLLDQASRSTGRHLEAGPQSIRAVANIIKALVGPARPRIC
jgi:hypothetical protein